MYISYMYVAESAKSWSKSEFRRPTPNFRICLCFSFLVFIRAGRGVPSITGLL